MMPTSSPIVVRMIGNPEITPRLSAARESHQFSSIGLLYRTIGNCPGG